MSSKQSVYTCHRAKLASLKGRLAEPKENYKGPWAYWCGQDQNGWFSEPCGHPLGTEHEPDFEDSFRVRKPLTKAEVCKLPGGTFVQVKWPDGPDTVHLLLAKPTRHGYIDSVSSTYAVEDTIVDFAQVVAVLGTIKWPSLKR